jgi:hypothetical protein
MFSIYIRSLGFLSIRYRYFTFNSLYLPKNCSEETSEDLRQRLTAADLEKRKMAAEIGKVSQENEANLRRINELQAVLPIRRRWIP